MSFSHPLIERAVERCVGLVGRLAGRDVKALRSGGLMRLITDPRRMTRCLVVVGGRATVRGGVQLKFIARVRGVTLSVKCRVVPIKSGEACLCRN